MKNRVLFTFIALILYTFSVNRILAQTFTFYNSEGDTVIANVGDQIFIKDCKIHNSKIKKNLIITNLTADSIYLSKNKSNYSIAINDIILLKYTDKQKNKLANKYLKTAGCFSAGSYVTAAISLPLLLVGVLSGSEDLTNISLAGLLASVVALIPAGITGIMFFIESSNAVKDINLNLGWKYQFSPAPVKENIN